MWYLTRKIRKERREREILKGIEKAMDKTAEECFGESKGKKEEE